ncbi:unnamed protein product, partial [Prorocentrum cordatum]
ASHAAAGCKLGQWPPRLLHLQGQEEGADRGAAPGQPSHDDGRAARRSPAVDLRSHRSASTAVHDTRPAVVGGPGGRHGLLALQASRRVWPGDDQSPFLADEPRQARAGDPAAVLHVPPHAHPRRVWQQWAWALVGVWATHHAGRLPGHQARQIHAQKGDDLRVHAPDRRLLAARGGFRPAGRGRSRVAGLGGGPSSSARSASGEGVGGGGAAVASVGRHSSSWGTLSAGRVRSARRDHARRGEAGQGAEGPASPTGSAITSQESGDGTLSQLGRRQRRDNAPPAADRQQAESAGGLHQPGLRDRVGPDGGGRDSPVEGAALGAFVDSAGPDRTRRDEVAAPARAAGAGAQGAPGAGAQGAPWYQVWDSVGGRGRDSGGGLGFRRRGSSGERLPVARRWPSDSSDLECGMASADRLRQDQGGQPSGSSRSAGGSPLVVHDQQLRDAIDAGGRSAATPGDGSSGVRPAAHLGAERPDAGRRAATSTEGRASCEASSGGAFVSQGRPVDADGEPGGGGLEAAAADEGRREEASGQGGVGADWVEDVGPRGRRQVDL